MSRLHAVSTFSIQIHTLASLRESNWFFFCFHSLSIIHPTLHSTKTIKKHVQRLWKGNSAGVLANAIGRFFFFNKNILQFWSRDMSVACLIHSVLLLKILLSDRPEIRPANVHMLQVFYTFHYLHGSSTHKQVLILCFVVFCWLEKTTTILQREGLKSLNRGLTHNNREPIVR